MDTANNSFPDFDTGLNIIGVGYNSSLLSALFSIGVIASKTWSLALGWQRVQPNLETDGNLVIGGYDSVQANNQNVSYAFGSIACGPGPEVTISDISINFSNGSSPSSLMQSSFGLSNTGSTFGACLSLTDPIIVLPTVIFEKLRNITNFRILGSSRRVRPGGTSIASLNACV